MELASGGYNRTQYIPNEFRALVKQVASALPAILTKLNADTVVVTGKSGVSVGFAVSMLIDINLAVVRKPSENSHGRDVEGAPGHVMRRYIILDDFIDTGRTVARVINEINSNVWSAGEEPLCVGVVQYTRPDQGLDSYSTSAVYDAMSGFGLLCAPKVYGMWVGGY